jgi:hypothetical protein
MSGRGGRGYRGGRGNSGRGGHGRGRGQNYTGTGSVAKKGLCITLGNNVFDYGQKAAADQMRTTWEKLVQHVDASYGQDITDKLQNKKTVTLVQPAHAADVLLRHTTRERMIRTAQQNIHRARIVQQVALLAAVTAGEVGDAPMKVAILENEIAQGEFEASVKIPIDMNDSEKTQHINDWRSCRERNADLLKHRGQAFSLILGQCTQLLQDKMKQDADWTAVSTS